MAMENISAIAPPYLPTLRLSLRDEVEGSTRGPLPWLSARPGYRTTQPPCFSHTALFPGLPASGAKARR